MLSNYFQKRGTFSFIQSALLSNLKEVDISHNKEIGRHQRFVFFAFHNWFCSVVWEILKIPKTKLFNPIMQLTFYLNRKMILRGNFHACHIICHYTW